jgi:hypothetical protein
MESWDSSNTDHRYSDNSEITKEIIVNDHQQHSNYQDTSTIHTTRSKFGFLSNLIILFVSQVILFLNLNKHIRYQ